MQNEKVSKEAAIAAQSKKYITKKEFISYPLGMFGFAMMLGFVNTYSSFLFTDIMKIPLASVSAMLLITRLFDAFNDPLMGILVDHTNTKFGKLRPYVIFSGPLLMLSIVLMFAPWGGMTNGVKVFVMYATYLIYGISITLAEIPANGMATVATPNEGERATFITFSSIARSIGQSAPMVVVTVLLFLMDENLPSGEKNPAPYFVGAILCGIIGVVLFSFIFFNNKERLHIDKQGRSFGNDLKSLAKNAPFLLYILSLLLGLGRGLGGAMMQTYVANTLLGGAKNTIILAIPSAVGSFAGMLVARWLLSKIDLKKVYLFFCGFAGVTQILMYFIYKGTNGNIWAFFAIYALSSIQWGGVALFPQLFCADGVDYAEWQSGTRNEGSTIAIFGCANKAANAVASAAMVSVLALVGYNPQLSEMQTPATQDNMLILFTLVPAAFNIVSAIPMFFYRFAGQRRKDILTELNERRIEQKVLKED